MLHNQRRSVNNVNFMDFMEIVIFRLWLIKTMNQSKIAIAGMPTQYLNHKQKCWRHIGNTYSTLY